MRFTAGDGVNVRAGPRPRTNELDCVSMPPRAARYGVPAALLLLGAALLFPSAQKADNGAEGERAVPQGSRETPKLEESSSLEPTSDAEEVEDASSSALGCRERPLQAPSGAPPRVSCEEARAILAETHARYAGNSTEPDPRIFAALVAGWLDPHGLWSAAPDSPLTRSLEESARGLLAELRLPPHATASCEAALRLGEELRDWVVALEKTFDEAQAKAPRVSSSRAFSLFSESIFQDDPVTRPGRVLARRLGERTAHFRARHPDLAEALEPTARSRYFPRLSGEGWAEAVLAAAVRAYVPLLDPHGAWAPLDEEWSLYSEDPGFDGAPRLWGEVTRTAVAVRVLSDALPPLENGDLILSIDGISTVGMPLEQLEQLSRLEPAHGGVRRVVVLRAREASARELAVNVVAEVEPDGARAFAVDGERVRYGDGNVLVVRLPDVPEGLGAMVGQFIAEQRDPSLRGVVLDLRGNGGGSTDAAAGVLGLFLPGAPLFPLATRGRLVEVMRAPTPAPEERWDGPVATIVDGYTASAAEMIAGALVAYQRGVLLGRQTFGKGCIQEYADDHTGHGVLRVTTLLYALPNGAAVQRHGLVPDVFLPVERARDREADVGAALPGYSGPDVRDSKVALGPLWPPHGGEIGRTSDPIITAALKSLGAPRGAPRTIASRRLNLRATSAATGLRP